MKGLFMKIMVFLPDRLQYIIRLFLKKVKKKFFLGASTGLVIKSFGNFKVAHREGTADEDVLMDSFDQDIFFSRIPEYKPAKDHIIIDVGAHIGAFSLLAASKVPAGRVHSIEASEDSANLLSANVALNNATNISVYHLALSDKNGICTLYHDSENWGHSIVKSFSSKNEIVDCCTLTKFLEINNIYKCDLIKFNCEGAEFPIILNTPSIILQRFVVVLVLYHCDLWSGNKEIDLISHFQNSGFNTRLINKREERGWIHAEKIM